MGPTQGISRTQLPGTAANTRLCYRLDASKGSRPQVDIFPVPKGSKVPLSYNLAGVVGVAFGFGLGKYSRYGYFGLLAKASHGVHPTLLLNKPKSTNDIYIGPSSPQTLHIHHLHWAIWSPTVRLLSHLEEIPSFGSGIGVDRPQNMS